MSPSSGRSPTPHFRDRPGPGFVIMAVADRWVDSVRVRAGQPGAGGRFGALDWTQEFPDGPSRLPALGVDKVLKSLLKGELAP